VKNSPYCCVAATSGVALGLGVDVGLGVFVGAFVFVGASVGLGVSVGSTDVKPPQAIRKKLTAIDAILRERSACSILSSY